MWQRIKNFFRKGAVKMGFSTELAKITDHPKIAVSQEDYDRIDLALSFFKGEWPEEIMQNTYGKSFFRDFIGLNMAKVVCRRLASLIFNEQVNISITNKTADEFVSKTFDNNDFGKNFERYLESDLALGGLAMKPYVEENKVKIAYVQAPSFYPLRTNTNDVNEAAIATNMTKVIGDKKVYFTLLEFHEWEGENYVITNELYRSELADKVGIKVPLTDYFDDPKNPLQEQTVSSEFSRPLFTYLKPFGMNNKDITSPLGLSIYDNAISTLRQINETYNEFRWEIKMGQRRIGVTDDMTTVAYDDNGNPIQYFDIDQNVFIPVGDIIDGAKLADLTSPIRSDAYIRALNHFLRTLESEVGLSSGTFTFDGMATKTATEIVSENSMTYQTRNSHLSNVERAIKELIVSICELGKAYDLYSGEIPKFEDIILDFDDGVFLDRKSELDFFYKAKAGGMASSLFAIKKIWNVTDEEAQKMLDEINAEQASQIDASIRGIDKQMIGKV